MDTIAIDLSQMQDAKLGDEALLWGVEHPIEILADSANTVSYELMTSIRGPRIYIWQIMQYLYQMLVPNIL